MSGIIFAAIGRLSRVVKATTKANSSYTPSFDFKSQLQLAQATLEVVAGTT